MQRTTRHEGKKCMNRPAWLKISESLHRAFPALKFVDDQRWPESEPPIADGIHCCKSRWVYLWPSDVVSRLPSLPLPPAMQLQGNMSQGPSSDPVIQFARCIERDGQLEVGQLSAYIEGAKSPLGKAHSRVIAFLKKQYSCRLDCFSLRTGELLNENVGGYLVGRAIQSRRAESPRLALAFGRDEYMVPRK